MSPDDAYTEERRAAREARRDLPGYGPWDDVPSPSDLAHDDMGGRLLPCGPAGLVPFDADLPVVDGEVPF